VTAIQHSGCFLNREILADRLGNSCNPDPGRLAKVALLSENQAILKNCIKMTSERNAYLARAGRHGEDEEACFELGLSIVGWQTVPSFESAADFDGVRDVLSGAYPDAPKSRIGNFAGQLYQFVHGMQEGDLVVLPLKRTPQVALGRVNGPYAYREVAGVMRHTRGVQWIKTDIPRSAFEQDLLHSFGAFMTVCSISRNHAVKRIESVLATGRDPGGSVGVEIRGRTPGGSVATDPGDPVEASFDLQQVAHDQIVAHIQSRFAGHALTDLVDAVLRADGWATKVSPPGPDEGVDILAGRGPFGLDSPRLVVQVKSKTSTADVTVYRGLQGSMQTYSADQGLLVCWGGYTAPVLKEARQSHFAVRLWDSRDLVQAIYRTYPDLPAEIQAELPLKRSWILVTEEDED